MKRASSTLVLHLKKTPRSHIPICSNHHITQFSSIPTNDSQNHDYPSKFHLKSCLDTHLFLQAKRHPIDKFATFIDPQNQTSQLSPRQEKIKEALQILNEFEAAKTSDEMINVLEKMKCIFDDNDLGDYYVKIALKLEQEESEDRAMIFVSMAKALFNQDNISEAKICLQMACEILDDKEQSSPIEVSEAYMEISVQYGKMNELETSVSLIKKTTAMLEKISNEQGSFGSALPRIWWLLNLLGEVQDTTNLLKDATERLKEIVGSKHFEVGYVFNSLGEDYMEINSPKSAAQFLSLAEAIMNTALGPHHVVSIEACQNLSRAYSAMGSYALAINFQKKAIGAWRECGPSEEDQLERAQRVLKRLKITQLMEDSLVREC